jgi:hypothetical protein
MALVADNCMRSVRVLMGPLLVSAMTASSLTVGPATTAAQAAPAPPSAARTAPDERSALALAKASDERVEVLDERTEVSQMFAEPTGRLTYEATAVPQRVRRAGNAWADVDLNLAPGSDGALRPRASVSDVRFSPDGTGPLVTAVRHGKTLTLTWPGPSLRPPSVDRDTATYPEVLPGVDLAVRATPTGFSHVLKVKTAAAAANPELRRITFELGGDARVQRLTGGALSAVADSVLVATAPAPAMWDSQVPPVAARAAAPRGAVSDPSSPSAPGDAARVAAVETEVTPTGDLVLKPDAGMLSGQATFPLFIDPAWSTGKSRWAYATNNNSNNTDTSVARVGRDPNSSKVYRSFFEFATKKLAAKHIESAYVQMKIDHSFTCEMSWTHMYRSGSLTATPRTKWSTKLLTRVSAAESHANEGRGCPDSPQNDMWVNFTGSGVTSMLANAASKGNATVTVGFSAGNAEGEHETDKERWKKFLPGNAKLIADVDAKPGKPNYVQINGVACTTAGIRIGLTNPYFSANFPDADKSQSISGTWEWGEVTASGTVALKTAPARTSAAANSRATTARVSGAANGKRYAVRVKATDPAPYNMPSDFSDWCYFIVDTAVPDITVTELSKPAGPGKPGEYLLASRATDTVTFQYGWEEVPEFQVPAGTVAGVAGRAAKVTVTAPSYGINVLHAQAIDSTKNKGYGSWETNVGRPTPAVAQWGLETYPGVSQEAALADSAPAIAGDTPLAPTNVGWAGNARLVGAQSAVFGGSSYLSTSGPVVDTMQSFSVSAWVRLGALPTAVDMVAMSQNGSQMSGFVLGTRLMGSPATPRWAFTMRDSDEAVTPAATAYSPSALTSSDVGRWTHLVGVYDKAAKRLTLHVNGNLVTETPRTGGPWAANGSFVVGRGQANSQPANWFNGNVVDAQVFDRALVSHDFTGQLAGEESSEGADLAGVFEPVQVGSWNFNEAVSCVDPTIEFTCEAMDSSTWGRRLQLSQGVAIGGSSTHGQGAWLDDTLDVDPEHPHYGTTTREYAISQRDTAPPGESAQWQEAPVLRTDRSFTVSTWVHVDSIGRTMTAIAPKGNKQSPFYLGTRQTTVNGVTGTHFVAMTVSADQDLGETYSALIAPTPLDIDDEGSWSLLTLVHDAEAKSLTLYVNGKRAAPPKTGVSMWNASGPLLVGGAWYSGDNNAGNMTDRWFGGIDEVLVYQGALTAPRVSMLYDEQAPPEVD